MVTFSYGMEAQGSATCTVALGSEPLPFRGLYHVLLSMKAVALGGGGVGGQEDELSLARLSASAAAREGDAEVEPAPRRRPELGVLFMVTWHLKGELSCPGQGQPGAKLSTSHSSLVLGCEGSEATAVAAARSAPGGLRGALCR